MVTVFGQLGRELDIPGERELQLRELLYEIEAFSDVGGLCPLWAVPPRMVVLGCIKQQTEQAIHEGQASKKHPSVVPTQYLPVGSCLEFLPSIFFSMGYNYIPLLTPSFLSYCWLWCFYHSNRKTGKMGFLADRGDGVACRGTVAGCRCLGPLHPASWRESRLWTGWAQGVRACASPQ